MPIHGLPPRSSPAASRSTASHAPPHPRTKRPLEPSYDSANQGYVWNVFIGVRPDANGTILGTLNPGSTAPGFDGYSVLNGVQVMAGASPSVLLNPALSGSRLNFEISTLTGQTYIVEYKLNLADSNTTWQQFQTFNGDGTTHTISAPLTNRQCFYRCRVP